MYNTLLQIHSGIRYLVLLGLVVVIVKSFMGLINKSNYDKSDDRLSLFLFISTHTQLLFGLLLYFVSPFVTFGSTTMSDKITRYWTVEHLTGMLLAVALITIARISSKKMVDDTAKHKRMFIFNALALVIIVVIIVISDRQLVG
ncbi:MAG: cytochrome B [Chryseolinea sp.]